MSKAHVIEITKAPSIVFIKSINSLVVQCKEREKKTEDGVNLFFKAFANRFWLTSKNCSWFNKAVHGRPCIKQTL